MTERLETRATAYAPVVLSLFRIFFGLLFLCHATQKLFAWPVGPAAASGSLFWFAGLIELITGILITIGLFTRPAAFIASGEMFIAFLTQHLPNGFWPIANGGELAVMFCWAFFLLVFTGPGVWAVDTRTGWGGGEVYVRGHTRRAPRRWGRRYDRRYERY
jgi:putative oxidoreductase